MAFSRVYQGFQGRPSSVFLGFQGPLDTLYIHFFHIHVYFYTSNSIFQSSLELLSAIFKFARNPRIPPTQIGVFFRVNSFIQQKKFQKILRSCQSDQVRPESDQVLSSPTSVRPNPTNSDLCSTDSDLSPIQFFDQNRHYKYRRDWPDLYYDDDEWVEIGKIVCRMYKVPLSYGDSCILTELCHFKVRLFLQKCTEMYKKVRFGPKIQDGRPVFQVA